MTHLLKISISCLICMQLIACAKEYSRENGNAIVTPPPEPPVPPVETPKTDTVVYAAGYYSVFRDGIFTAFSIAVIWRNGVPIVLTDITHSARAQDVVAVGNDLYAVGFEYTDDPLIRKAMLWKNGIATALTDGRTDAVAYSIIVDGPDVYIGGFARKGDLTNRAVATLWKNGAATALTDGTYNGYIFSITKHGSDIYCGGSEGNRSSIDIAKYWKNGVAVSLSDGVYKNNISGIIADDNGVYASCTQTPMNTRETRQALLWNNKTRIALTDGKTNNASANAVIRVGSDLYVAGLEGSTAVIWKNQVPIYIADKSYWASYAADLCLFGNDLYAVGNILLNDPGYTAYPVLWKNNQETRLENNGGRGEAFSVFVRGEKR